MGKDKASQQSSKYGGGRFGHRTYAGPFKDYINDHFGKRKDMFFTMAWFAYGDRLSKKTIRQLIAAGFFQTDHIHASIGDDPENFFLMPAPHNVRFSQQCRQSFKEEFCAGAWEAVGYFVARVLAMQRKFGRY